MHTFINTCKSEHKDSYKQNKIEKYIHTKKLSEHFASSRQNINKSNQKLSPNVEQQLTLSSLYYPNHKQKSCTQPKPPILLLALQLQNPN